MESTNNPRRRRRRKSSSSGIVRLLTILFLVLAILLAINSCNRITNGDAPSTTEPSNSESTANTSGTVPDHTDGTQPSTTETTAPTEPFITSTASVGVTGDILMHGPNIKSAQEYASTSGSELDYDFAEMFTYVKDYYSAFDYMVANLEVTLGGPEAGEYEGYPTFNCPDDIVESLKAAGVDMLLTANNHSYDTGYNGFIRTQEVIEEKGLDHLGTRLSEDVPNYSIQDLNGIKVGMVCYTYDTRADTDERISLNGIILKSSAQPLVNTFDYSDPSGFYAEIEEVLEKMEADGAEATMVYIHWGYEYHLSPNNTQKNIAQKLCDLGVDVIVGGHPHVIQPFDVLTSESGNTTYCIYSLGNAVSNQRRESLNTVDNENYTEDGMIFGVEFQKWNDGTVEVSKISILPTWVNREYRSSGSTFVYNIIPLDIVQDNWDSFDIYPASRLPESYKRTMSLVGEGLNECLRELGLAEVPLEAE